MTVTVLLFASYADRLGASAVKVEVPEGGSVGDVVAALRAFPGGGVLPERPLVAVNQRYATHDQTISANDEVAVIPPVAGG